MGRLAGIWFDFGDETCITGKWETDPSLLFMMFEV